MSVNLTSSLTSISPIDGRYHGKTTILSNHFSELALMRYRIQVEVEYLIELSQEFNFQSKLDLEQLRKLYDIDWFNQGEGIKIKEIERVTNHDVKAIEYWLKERPEIPQEVKVWIHYGLTSQDINTSANMLQAREGWEQVIKIELAKLVDQLKSDALDRLMVPMLSRTHGQPASPTVLGKELLVFVERLLNQIDLEEQIPWTSKFGGAVGNFNSLELAHQEVNWKELADRLIQRLGMVRSQYTTQIDHYDHLAAHFDSYRRINTILIDLCRDIWTYISMDYFKLRIVANEVGSSAMPHKVNPIDFENAEGNLMLANSLFEFLSQKLPISRLQRDLTDSTVLRNVGVAYAHTLIALKSLLKGLGKLEVNQERITEDLKRNWVVIAEGIQTILKREGVTDGYERVKALTRVKSPNQEDLLQMVDELPISDRGREEILSLTPQSYLGII